MAKLNFVFDKGTLTATGPNTFVHTSSGDYVAKTIGEGTRIEVRPLNLDPRLPTFKLVTSADATIDTVEYGTSAGFVKAFNELAGTQIGYNTQYPQWLFSQHIELDTSVDQQIVPVPVINNHYGGYIIITAPSTNTGNVYVGESDVNPLNYALEPDHSITLELSDLSTIWVQNDTADDCVDVVGAYKG